MTVYKEAQSFIDQICLYAEQAHIKVVVVRSCYNQPGNLQKSQERDWWWSTILSLPERFRIFMERGTVNIVDGYPNLPLEYTPQGFFYRGGNLIWNGPLNAANPRSVMDTINRKLSENR
jgi:hypothetical protein